MYGTKTRCFILLNKTEISASDLPPSRTDTVVSSSTRDIQIFELSDDALKTKRHSSVHDSSENGGKGNGNNDDGLEDNETRLADDSMTVTGSTDIRNSTKRTVDAAGLNEGDECQHRSKKVQCTALIATLNPRQ